MYYEASWCSWPNHNSETFVSPQLNLDQIDINSLHPDNFKTSNPPTWMVPSRKQINYLARVLNLNELVIDFGCGNGFISSLLLDEELNSTYWGVDPYVSPNLNKSNFTHYKKLPKIEKPYALLSSQADKSVPLHLCFENRKPDIACFLLLPDLFGRGGKQVQLEFKNHRLFTTEETELFDMGELERLGYKKIFDDQAYSPFWDESKLLVYALPAFAEKVSSIQYLEIEPYPWEKTSDFKSSTTSELSLS